MSNNTKNIILLNKEQAINILFAVVEGYRNDLKSNISDNLQHGIDEAKEYVLRNLR